MIVRYVYRFGDGRADMRDLLGGKGANLAEMVRLRLPVPPGFIISTEACRDYYRRGRTWSAYLEEQVMKALVGLEGDCGRALGATDDPLLVSVRSGGAASMPGMMDTILNLGLDSQSAEGLGRSSGSAVFALDCYRRFIQMFGDVVLGIPRRHFEDVLKTARRQQNAHEDGEWDEEALREVVQEYLQLIVAHTGQPFPVSPQAQLRMAIRAVFNSWDNQRAIAYREMYGIPHDLGTAVTVQAMVFGNRGPRSATGVVFSRDPSTGAPRLYGEYLLNAQGEDVVAGIRTPRPIDEMADKLPEAYAQLERYARLLEAHYRDMQDIEFTVEQDRLYILQTRSGKRSVAASIRVAVDLAEEGVIDREEALSRVEPEALAQLIHPTVDSRAALNVLATGLPASPGAATGSIALDADSARDRADAGERVLLVRPETTPDDIHGIAAAQGVLTARGGMTCHAAIVARGMGKPCVVGCDAIRFDPRGDSVQIGDRLLQAEDILSIDGTTGRVILGEVPLAQPELSPYFRTLLAWADTARQLGVRANADTPADATRAREFGAQGIGLCRTEHMFMAQDRLPIVQAMILAETEQERRGYLEQLLPIQRADFAGILEAMAGLPVTIRLLDPPLHEFLPNLEELGEAVRNSPPGSREHRLFQRALTLRESNPMLGHRGVRLGISHPEVYEMQVRAIFEATADLVSRGVDAQPEIMIPLVGLDRELAFCHDLIARVAREVTAARGMSLTYRVGTMIEVPRACLAAGAIAAHAEFFSFGTNDLTQTTFGFSRDDAEAKFLARYLASRILTANPFVTIDRDGVGRLVGLAVEGGRRIRPDLKIGICGEHGGDPASIAFFHQAGLDYVSCSPFRVPIARLAAAQAALSRNQPPPVTPPSA